MYVWWDKHKTHLVVCLIYYGQSVDKWSTWNSLENLKYFNFRKVPYLPNHSRVLLCFIILENFKYKVEIFSQFYLFTFSLFQIWFHLFFWLIWNFLDCCFISSIGWKFWSGILSWLICSRLFYLFWFGHYLDCCESVGLRDFVCLFISTEPR
jgi:hypothetical protein